MKFGFGILFVLAGIILGLYLGLWVCFVGGIVQVIEAAKATPVNALDLALGVLRFFATGIVGWGSFALCFLVGGGLIKSS